ncbi:MAG: DUF128 domain-containing protein [Verrucomicrobiota bacterium]|nr:DUF128 domain-containing protein [Verrucomicrobiota bacterium]
MKLTPDDIKQRILKALLTLERPSGATQVGAVLRGWGLSLSDRSIRLYLLQLDAAGCTELKSRRHGRVLTPSGRNEAAKQDVLERMAFVSGQIDELNYRMGFHLQNGKGTLVVNTTLLSSGAVEEVIRIIRPVFAARLGMGTRVALLKAGAVYDLQHGSVVPEGKVALLTICSVTLNGILLKEGIPVTSRFGGLMEFKDHVPQRFVELLEYGGTTQDPLELFIRAHMTSVRKCAQTGFGVVGASFREFPSVALPEVLKIREQLKKMGLNGIVAIGSPNQPLYGLPVSEGRTGLVLLGGLNPVAALEESGVENMNRSLAGLMEYGRFSEFHYL